MSSTRRSVDVALERTPERDRNGRGGAEAAARGVAQNFAADGDRFIDALALIARAERVGGRHDHADFLQALGRERAVVAATIQYQARVRDVAALRQPSAHRFRVGHLRHARRDARSS